MPSILNESISFRQNLENNFNLNFSLVLADALSRDIIGLRNENRGVFKLRCHQRTFRVVGNVDLPMSKEHLIFHCSTFFEPSLGQFHL